MDRLFRYNLISAGSIKVLLQKIDVYSAGWEYQKQIDFYRLNSLRKFATIASVGSSTRIEGAEMSDEEVARLIDNMDVTKLVSRDEQEVAGYYKVLDIIQDEYSSIPINEFHILGLHNELMRYSAKDEYHRGRYKQLSNQVVATDENGNTRTIFKTTEVFQTPDALRDAIDWYHDAMEAGKYHKLEVIFAFIYEFLSIHPFQDGNGRLSRLLTHLLLLKNGYEFVMYHSFEQGIEDNKRNYYKTLMTAQRYRGTDEEEISRFMYFMLNTMYKLTGGVDKDTQTIVEEPQAMYLTRRKRRVLDFVTEKGELSISDVDALLSEVSRSTVKNDLAQLTEAGFIKRHGKGRGTVYTR